MISPLVVTLYAAALVPAASSPLYEVDWDVIDLESWDGVKLRVRAGFPKLSGGSEERFPMVLMANSWSVPNVEYVAKQLQWAEAGYVVVEYDARGWWCIHQEFNSATPPHKGRKQPLDSGGGQCCLGSARDQTTPHTRRMPAAACGGAVLTRSSLARSCWFSSR